MSGSPCANKKLQAVMNPCKIQQTSVTALFADADHGYPEYQKKKKGRNPATFFFEPQLLCLKLVEIDYSLKLRGPSIHVSRHQNLGRHGAKGAE